MDPQAVQAAAKALWLRANPGTMPEPRGTREALWEGLSEDRKAYWCDEVRAVAAICEEARQEDGTTLTREELICLGYDLGWVEGIDWPNDLPDYGKGIVTVERRAAYRAKLVAMYRSVSGTTPDEERCEFGCEGGVIREAVEGTNVPLESTCPVCPVSLSPDEKRQLNQKENT